MDTEMLLAVTKINDSLVGGFIDYTTVVKLENEGASIYARANYPYNSDVEEWAVIRVFRPLNKVEARINLYGFGAESVVDLMNNLVDLGGTVRLTTYHPEDGTTFEVTQNAEENALLLLGKISVLFENWGHEIEIVSRDGNLYLDVKGYEDKERPAMTFSVNPRDDKYNLICKMRGEMTEGSYITLRAIPKILRAAKSLGMEVELVVM